MRTTRTRRMSHTAPAAALVPGLFHLSASPNRLLGGHLRNSLRVSGMTTNRNNLTRSAEAGTRRTFPSFWHVGADFRCHRPDFFPFMDMDMNRDNLTRAVEAGTRRLFHLFRAGAPIAHPHFAHFPEVWDMSTNAKAEMGAEESPVAYRNSDMTPEDSPASYRVSDAGAEDSPVSYRNSDMGPEDSPHSYRHSDMGAEESPESHRLSDTATGHSLALISESRLGSGGFSGVMSTFRYESGGISGAISELLDALLLIPAGLIGIATWTGDG